MNETFNEVKTRLDGMALFYGEYRGNSVGRAIHYLWSICYNYADSVTFGYPGGLIKLYGRDFARLDWSKGYPYFNFLGEFEHLNTAQKKLLCNHSEIRNWVCLDCGYNTKHEYGYERGRFKNPT